MRHATLGGAAAVIAIFAASCSAISSFDGLAGDSRADAGPNGEGGAIAVDGAATPTDSGGVTSDANMGGGDAGADAGPSLVVEDFTSDFSDVVNLTTTGTLDWTHVGDDSDTDMKKALPHLLGPLTQSTQGGNPYSDDPRVFSWTDGTAHPTIAMTSEGTYDITGPMTLTAAASTDHRLLVLYIGTYSVSARLKVTLDGVATPVTMDRFTDGGAVDHMRVRIHYSSPLPSATLTASWTVTALLDSGIGASGNVAFIAAALTNE
jgi:hypothetical protein